VTLALLFLGFVLIMTGVNDTGTQLGQLLVSDFSGSGNFFYWIAAIVILGLIGYVPAFRTASRLFIGLIILVIFLSNQGIWANLTTALASPQTSTSSNDATTATGIQTAAATDTPGTTTGTPSPLSTAASIAGVPASAGISPTGGFGGLIGVNLGPLSIGLG
jgi:hypothetical protein